MQVPRIKISPWTALGALVSGVAMMAINALLLGVIVMLLWNWLVPIFIPKLPIVQHITYWQGWGITFLLHTLIPKK